jgi:hypothetical protein
MPPTSISHSTALTTRTSEDAGRCHPGMAAQSRDHASHSGHATRGVEQVDPLGTLYTFEIITLAVSVIGVAVTRWIPLNALDLIPGRAVDTLVTAFGTVLTLRLAAPALTWWRQRHELPPGALYQMMRSALGRRYVGFVVRSILCVQVVMLWFCILKYMLPLVRPMSADAALWRADELLHGFSPTLLMLVLTQDLPWLLRAADYYYVTYFPMLVLFTTYVLVQQRRPDLRARFIFGYVLLWIIGGLSYYLWPSMGPCYYKPELFIHVREHLPLASLLQERLLHDHLRFIADPWSHTPELYYGIAAMPSMHVAVLVYFALFARPFGRTLTFAAWTATLLTFIGSIVTGWHYAVDGYAALVPAILAYFVSMRLPARIPGNPSRKR